jgi:antitoxin Phd
MVWSLQDAKARFSELVNRTLTQGPQTVSRHGKPVVVLVPHEEYRRAAGRGGRLSAFLLSAPRVDLEIVREQEPEREIGL